MLLFLFPQECVLTISRRTSTLTHEPRGTSRTANFLERLESFDEAL